MEKHLLTLLVLADRVGQSRGVPVRDSEMLSKLYASMPEKITDWLDNLDAASTSTFIALRLELRRWTRKNEKVMTPARNARNAKVQVSVAHMDDDNDGTPDIVIADKT
ncbi:hypothetical protein FOL47_002806 [Perkinsus chesapeaki]|uniref:Uncharacterized protein n=1 Tax=Perkinsus chesapeaki TaxID=330153 RepID=A0A7J6KPC5_PERCH|nr:hypothetical protein FOL47_002806 [Perkinsus chesapeaki]